MKNCFKLALSLQWLLPRHPFSYLFIKVSAKLLYDIDLRERCISSGRWNVLAFYELCPQYQIKIPWRILETCRCAKYDKYENTLVMKFRNLRMREFSTKCNLSLANYILQRHIFCICWILETGSIIVKMHFPCCCKIMHW